MDSSTGLSSGAVAATADDGGSAGTVFAETNAPTGNRIRAYRRSADGRLTRTGAFETGGNGSGVFEQVANSLILGSSRRARPRTSGAIPGCSSSRTR